MASVREAPLRRREGLASSWPTAIRHPAQRAGDAPGGDRPAGQAPGRHAVHQDPRRGSGGGESRSAEGHRQRPPGLHRAPHWAGGGVALGPKPRKLRPAHPEEDDRLALALGAARPRRRGQGARGRRWGFDGRHQVPPSRPLGRSGVEGTALVVLDRDDVNAVLELPQPARRSQVITPGELNAYDVLCNDTSCSPRRRST